MLAAFMRIFSEIDLFLVDEYNLVFLSLELFFFFIHQMQGSS